MLTKEAVRIVRIRWRTPILARFVGDERCDWCREPLPMLEMTATTYDVPDFQECRALRYAIPGAYHSACCGPARERFSAEVESLRWTPSFGPLRSPSQATPKPPSLARDALQVSTPKDSG